MALPVIADTIFIWFICMNAFDCMRILKTVDGDLA